MIVGSSVRSLLVHTDDRGRLFEILRCDDPEFQRFGQVYLTTARPGIIKGWHLHRIQTDHFCLIDGRARFVLYDDRPGSLTLGQIDEILCEGTAPQLIVIPPLVYHGFMNVGDRDAICLNCPTEPYNRLHPDEYHLDPRNNHIPYDWDNPINPDRPR